MHDQRQAMLLPPSYEDLVPKNHPVRVVDEVIITEREEDNRSRDQCRLGLPTPGSFKIASQFIRKLINNAQFGSVQEKKPNLSTPSVK